MINAGQALMNAIAATAQPDGQMIAGNVVAELKGDTYKVFVVRIIPAVDHSSNSAIWVEVDKVTGRVQGRGAVALAESGMTSPTIKRGLMPISAAAAYQSGLSAVQDAGIHYDEYGRLTVTLEEDQYVVTFPEFPLAEDEEGADFAYQVWIDAGTGIKKQGLFAS